MQKTKYYFIEDYNPNIDLSDGVVVSLFPDVSYKLGKQGINYKILEEFYDEEGLRKEEDKYFFEQLEWVDQLDEYLRKNITLCKDRQFNITRAYFNKIKYLIDTLIIQSHIIRQFVIGNKKCEITYIYDSSKMPQSKEIHLYNASERIKFIPQILSALSDIDRNSLTVNFKGFESQYVEGLTACGRNKKGQSRIKFLRKGLKRGYHILKYGKVFSFFCSMIRKGKNQKRVLFLQSSTDVSDHVMRKFLRKGYNVYYLSEDNVYFLNSVFERTVFSVKEMESDGDYQDIKKITALISKGFDLDSPLIEWINIKCGFDATKIIAPFFRHYLEDVCGELLWKAERFKWFYECFGINVVVATNASDNNSKAALISAKSAKVDRVGFQHGTDVYNNRNWHINDIDNFDYYFTFEPLAEKRFKKALKYNYVSDTKIFQMSYKLTHKSGKISKCCGQLQRKFRVSPRKRILYVPASKSNVHSRCYNNMTYPVLWYYEFQKKMIDYFASREDIDFIYKHADTKRQWASVSIVPYIKEKNSKNIFVETRPIHEYFGRVDAVVVDRPTTPIFEAAMLNKALLCLIPEFLLSHIDKNAFTMFWNTIHTFKTNDEAILCLEKFIEKSFSGKTQSKINISFRNDDIFEVLTDAYKTGDRYESRKIC